MSGTADIRSLVNDGFHVRSPEWLLDCSFVEESAAALALGALDQDESIRINYHLSWCPVCARLIHETRKTVGYLPFLSPAATPSPSAKAALFARIESARALQAESPSSISLLPLTIPASNPAPPAGAFTRAHRLTHAARAHKRRFNWELIVAPLAAVPLVVALAIVGGWALRTQDRLDSQVAQAQDLRVENADLSAQVSLLSSGVANASTRTFDLDSSDSALGASGGGSVVTVGDQPWAKLSVWDLPASATGYKVLVETQDGKLIPAAEFTVDQTGSGEIELSIDRPLDQYQSIHIQHLDRTDRTSTSDSLVQEDILWLELDSNLGSPAGTEANAKAH